MDITFITGNVGKLAQVQKYLSYPITHQKLDLTEIQSLDAHEVVRHKAEEAYKHIGKPVLIEDTALTFHALNKLPGTFIKWFLHELQTEGLCRLLDHTSDRSATAQVTFGLFDGQQLHYFEAQVPGHIASTPRGDKDFGWGPIFIPAGYEQTWGEMSIEEQEKTSIRKAALAQMDAYLATLT